MNLKSKRIFFHPWANPFQYQNILIAKWLTLDRYKMLWFFRFKQRKGTKALGTDPLADLGPIHCRANIANELHNCSLSRYDISHSDQLALDLANGHPLVQWFFPLYSFSSSINRALLPLAFKKLVLASEILIVEGKYDVTSWKWLWQYLPAVQCEAVGKCRWWQVAPGH